MLRGTRLWHYREGKRRTPPTITSSAPAAPAYGVAYSHTYTATGTTPITWSVSAGALPTGLSINAGTGAITGTPTASGAFSWTVTATNAAGTDDQAASVEVLPGFTCTTTGAQTLTIAEFTVSASTTIHWGDGSSNAYTGSGARTHNYAGAGTYNVYFSAATTITSLTLSDNKITLNSAGIKSLTNITDAAFSSLKAGTFNSADVSAWRPTYFKLYSMPSGYTGTFNSSDVSAWSPSDFRLSSMPAGYNTGSFNSSDVSAWSPSDFRLSFMPAGYTGSFNSSDVSAWSPTNFYLYGMPSGYTGTFDSSDVTAWRPTTFQLYSMPAGYTGSFNSSDVSAWRPTTFYLLSMPAGYAGTFDSSDVTAWRPTTFYLYSMPAGYAGTFDSSDVSAWSPSDFRLYAMPSGYTIVTTAGGFAGWITTSSILMGDNGLSQAQVDQILADLYVAFATRTVSAGAINLSGTNAAPSGTYGAACPPATGKEYAYELKNDSCAINPTKKWAAVTTR